MANKRAVSWSAAMRDLENGRGEKADVREETLRTAAGLRGSGGLRLSAWRGRSGRRYVVGVHALDAADGAEVADAVVIAVRRDEAGLAQVIDVASTGSAARAVPEAWIRRASDRGATEMHVHRLAEGAAERRAIVDDLVVG